MINMPRRKDQNGQRTPDLLAAGTWNLDLEPLLSDSTG